jgi:hypothetical protein
MNTALHAYMAGMGAPCATGSNIAHSAVSTGLHTTATILLMTPTPATVIAAGVLELANQIQSFFFHPDCNKIATTEIVDQAGKFLDQNLHTWLALSPAEKTPDTQQAALINFDNVWGQVVKACGTGQYGTAGINCIGDRQAGSCHYHVAPGAGCPPEQSTCWVKNTDGTWSLSYAGLADSGTACWNWFIGLRDPIANDPQVAANVAAAAAAAAASKAASPSDGSAAGGGGAVFGIDPTLLLIGGGLLLAFVLAEEI